METTTYNIAYKTLMERLHRYWRASQKAEQSILKTWNTCRSNFDAVQEDVKNKVPGAQNRLPIARKALEEAEKLKDANWLLAAIIELLATQAVSQEKRLRLPPSIIAWIDENE